MVDIIASESMLDCGVKLVTFQRPGNPLTEVRYQWDVGSLAEPLHQAGISHFVEHLMFCDCDGMFFNDFVRAMEPGRINARTGTEYMAIEFLALNEGLLKTLALLEKLRQGSSYKPEVVNTERTRIVNEMTNNATGPYGQAHRILEQAMNKGTRLMLRSGGEPEILRDLSVEELKKHWQTYYGDSNATLYILSPYDHQYVVEMANQLLTPAHKGVRQVPPQHVAKHPGGIMMAIAQDAQVHVEIIREGVLRDDFFANRSAHNMFGTYLSEMLSAEIVHGKKLLYGIGYSTSFGQSRSISSIEYSTDPGSLLNIAAEVQKVCDKSIADPDVSMFEVARRRNLFNLALEDQQPSTIDGLLSEYEATGRIARHEEKHAALMAVHLEEAIELGRKRMSSQPFLYVRGNVGEDFPLAELSATLGLRNPEPNPVKIDAKQVRAAAALAQQNKR